VGAVRLLQRNSSHFDLWPLKSSVRLLTAPTAEVTSLREAV
jgi:hypothetical protein